MSLINSILNVFVGNKSKLDFWNLSKQPYKEGFFLLKDDLKNKKIYYDIKNLMNNSKKLLHIFTPILDPSLDGFTISG